MAPTEKTDTLTVDGATKGDILVGFEGWTQGIELEALEDIRPSVDRISASVKVLSAGSLPYSYQLEPYVGQSFTGTEIHDLVRKPMGEKYLKFLSPSGYRVRPGSGSTSHVRLSIV